MSVPQRVPILLCTGLVSIRDKSKRAINLSDFTFHDDKATIDKLGRKNAWELRAKAGAVLGEKEEKIVRHATTPTESHLFYTIGSHF